MGEFAQAGFGNRNLLGIRSPFLLFSVRGWTGPVLGLGCVVIIVGIDIAVVRVQRHYFEQGLVQG
jgi:hypothetical protein